MEREYIENLENLKVNPLWVNAKVSQFFLRAKSEVNVKRTSERMSQILS